MLKTEKRKSKQPNPLLIVALWLTVICPAFGAVISSVAVPSTRTDGTTITASIWNNDVIGIYTYINNTLVNTLNVLTTKGDQYVYNGSNLTRLPVGTDGQILTSDSGTATGLQWAAFANSTPLTTKGDILTYSSTPVRLGIGSDNQLLIADSTQTTGNKWGSPSVGIPKGTVMAWSPQYAGSSVAPNGWAFCDGVSGPNLIGKFVLGTRPPGSSAVAASGGYGAQTADANGTGTATHTHGISASFSTGYPTGLVQVDRTSPTSFEVSGQSHVHNVSYSGTTDSATTEPSDYALVYIIKL